MTASDHELEAIFRRAVEQRGDQAAPPRPYEMLLYLTPTEPERPQKMRNKPFLLAAVGVAVAALAVGAVVATNENRTETGPTDTSTPTSTPTSTSTSTPPSSATAPDDGSVDPADGTPEVPLEEAERLRVALGASRIVAHDEESSFVATAEGGRILPVDGWSIVDDYAYDAAAGGFIDLTGELVCPYELLGDFINHVGSRTDGDDLIIVLEDRRFLVEAETVAPVEADLPRIEYNCTTEESANVASTARVTREASEDDTVVTRQVGSQQLVERRGIGDTPLEVSLDGGPVLISRDELAYDYQISEDQTVLYYTSWASTGAGEPPVRLTAVDLSGQILWTFDQPAFMTDEFGDLLVVTILDTSNVGGSYPPQEVAVINRSTGEVVATEAFELRLVSVD